MSTPLDTHWKTVKRILRYLSGTIDYGIQIQKSGGNVSAFSDSNWTADLDDRRSTSGICSYLGSNLISWCVKKQNVVARSSTEAEYRSLAQAACEVTWLNSLLREMKIQRKGSPVIWVDNLSAIALASNPVMHARTKHIELDMHFVRDKVLAGEVELRHVPTHDQIADILTKPLNRQSFVKLREKLGVVSLSTLELRGCVKRGEHEIRTSDQLKKVCNMKMDEVGSCDESVHECGARDKFVKAANKSMDKGTTPTQQQDHKTTWRDVVLGRLMKKCAD